jgi:UDP-N-acetylmuramate: L-alanyl-gamma-D-glutamyl-meso-diaminopimelate ligase
MRIHLIAMGGSVMHNLAIALQKNGHQISGSDDEIYDPAYSQLKKHGLLPPKMGWESLRIEAGLDAVIVGMHARKDNPELLRALELKLPVYSFPEYIGRFSKAKKKIVIAGSHGKTTTTSMIMHILKDSGRPFDYLVGARLQGFDTMVQLSDAPVIVIEGDEYLSSPIDLRPKFLHYDPDLLVITGIAWDHINVFPTYEEYCKAFQQLIDNLSAKTQVIWFQEDEEVRKLIERSTAAFETIPYKALDNRQEEGRVHLTGFGEKPIPLKIFGDHNLQNLSACWEVCRRIGMDAERFTESVRHFKGAARRLQLLHETENCAVYLDFAHAPSKAQATVSAIRSLYPDRKLIACLELHSFSSLNPEFLPQYGGTLDKAEHAVIFFSEHTLEMKKLPPLSSESLGGYFRKPGLVSFTQKEALKKHLFEQKEEKTVLVLMSSGRFQELDVKSFASQFCDQ